MSKGWVVPFIADEQVASISQVSAELPDGFVRDGQYFEERSNFEVKNLNGQCCGKSALYILFRTVVKRAT